MASMIVRYRVTPERVAWGRLTSAAPTGPDEVFRAVDLSTDAATTSALIAQFEAGGVPDGDARELPGAALLSPVTDDATLVCQGLNYADHAAEAAQKTRSDNLLFPKASSSICGPYDDIVRPHGVELLDYEIEVGIVLRNDLRPGADIGEADIGRAIAGVVLCNDISARDVMFGATFMQWYKGKSYRTFCPTGPVLYLLDPEEVAPTLESLEISLTYKDQQRQSARTDQLIFKPAETLSQIAAIMDLKRGDMVLTGTPGGVLARATPAVVETLKQRLFDAPERRCDELRTAMKQTSGFLEPGDVLTLRMRDLHGGRDLGGQHSRIAGA